jgi:hypothetical protein
MVLDVLLPLPYPVRAFAIAGLAAYAFISSARLASARRSSGVPLERAARMVEERHPELDNALINAVQFAEGAAPSDPSSDSLKRREMERAERAASNLGRDVDADSGPAARARNRLLLAGLGVAVSILIFPRAWRFETPRFLFFWQDYPPFTLTDFAITPGDAHVKLVGSVPIEVHVGGQLPESLSLVVRDRTGERVTPLLAGDASTYSQTLEGLTEDCTYFIRGDTGRSSRYAIHIDRAPEVRAIKATLTPPAYTGKPRTTITVGESAIVGLNGTTVDLEVDASRPATGQITLVDSQGNLALVVLTPDSAHANSSHARFTISRDASYKIDLRSADGQERKNAAHGKIVLLRDEKPVVYITAPGQNAVVTPDMRIAIRAEAEDDVAVRQIEIHRILNSMADSAQDFPTPARPKANATMTLDLKDLGARPGDVIQYYATAYDNDPGKPNLTDSDRYWFWVVTPGDYRRLLAQQRDLPKIAADYRALTDSLRFLAERQRSLADRAAAGQPIQREQSALRHEAQELAQAMRDLVGQPAQVDAERGLKRKLAELARQLDQAASGAMKRAESGEAVRHASEAARQLESASGQSRQSIDKALRAMENVAPLYDDIAHLQELAKRQTDLAIQARQAASQVRPNSLQKSRLEDLAQRQSETRDMLTAVRQNLEDHAKQAENDALRAAGQARSLAKALDSLSVSNQMASASSAFGRQQAEEGAGQAENARRSLEKLFQQSRGAQAACKSGLDQQLSLCLGQTAGNSLEQLSRSLGTKPGSDGQGVAQGQGGVPAPQPGSRPGDSPGSGLQSKQAMAFTALQPQAGRSERRENRRHVAAGEPPATLGSEDVEHAAGPARPPGFAADSAPGRYPAEYRRLVKDYFKSVAGGSK